VAWSIPVAFVDQFSATVRLLAEQQESALRRYVTVDTEIRGDAKALELLDKGQDTANVVAARHGDTIIGDQTHLRRWLYTKPYDVADLIDREDRVRTLLDPSGPYTTRHAGTMGRTMDDVIIAAMGGPVQSGHDGATTLTFPSGQVIAAGGTGLTIAKLRKARTKFAKAFVPKSKRKYIVCTSQQIEDLLSATEVTSADYNVVKALVNGEVNSFMGFEFIECERLPVASNIRSCYAFTSDAIVLGVAQDVQTRASERPDKRYAWQIYTSMDIGAVRLEDSHVVQIDCAE
jgi:hypothetical protein